VGKGIENASDIPGIYTAFVHRGEEKTLTYTRLLRRVYGATAGVLIAIALTAMFVLT
jgi:hypothetical protein